MRRRVWGFCGWSVVLAIFALAMAGCGQAPAAPSGAPSATASNSPARLVAGHAGVQLSREGAAARAIQPGDSVDIRPKDQVAIDETGRAFIQAGSLLEIELIKGAQIQATDISRDPSGTTVLKLKQNQGHSYTRLDSTHAARLELDTDYATTTALTDHTQFLVCQAPGVLTCVVTVNGTAQVEAQNKVVTLQAGEGTYVLPGQPPRQPFCADMAQVRDWMTQVRAAEPAADLGSAVVGWLQAPCTGASASANAAGAASSMPEPTAADAATPTSSSKATDTATPVSTPQATDTAIPTNTPAPTAPPTPSLPTSVGMVKIDAGSYVVGAAADDYHAASHAVDLPEFWIDKYEVTNAQYMAFLTGSRHSAPASWVDGVFPSGHGAFPAAGLTWSDAAAYCTWVNKRLPTEAEWEVAGRGPGAQPPLYPWGADPTAGGQVDSLPQRDAYPVGSIAFNKSPFGVYDLTGSLWQWVANPYGPVPAGTQLLRGGRHGLVEDLAYRQPAGQDDERFTRLAGVRCAADRTAGG